MLSPHRLSAPPPEVPIEEQEERSLHEDAQPEATEEGLLAAQQEPSNHDVEQIEPGVEAEDGQQFGRSSPFT